MRFIAGPRQCGKSTMAKAFLESAGCAGLYYNWDLRSVRQRYRTDPHFFMSDLGKDPVPRDPPWICMDEIHKYPKWKNVLKDFFDSCAERARFVVTGSARLDMFRRSGDSLTGRFFMFHLHPLALREVAGTQAPAALPEGADALLAAALSQGTSPARADALSQLLVYGGFPEPFLRAKRAFHTMWQREYVDSIVGQDLRDITGIRETENVASLMQLLPERIGSPLSVNSLARDLECGHATVKGYLQALVLAYVLFRVRPYARTLARALTKEEKVYFFDWSRVDAPGSRFENYVALELWTVLQLASDRGEGPFELRYIRTRDGKETDFCVLRKGQPWLLAEAKLQRSPVDFHHHANRRALGGIPFVQVVREEGVAEEREPGVVQISASRMFA